MEPSPDAKGRAENARELPVLLVVDDDPDILRVVRFYLTKQKYLVRTATSGEEALAVLQEQPDVELILSDVMMPRMSGLELLQAVRDDSRLSDIPVILISAEGETSKKVTGLNLGADDFITKPFNFDELMARVRNHIRLRRLQKEVLMANRMVMEANRMLQQQNDRFQEDMDAARGVQMALMPDALPERQAYRFATRYLPAERLGGDFFDIVQLDDARVGVLIADVCGHGVTAAFITAMTKICFQNACLTSRDPAEVLVRMNRELITSLKNGFVTAFYAVYDAEARTLSYASGGHPPLLVLHPDGAAADHLEPQATFLGVFEDVAFRTDTTTLAPGDRVLFYTDGLYESVDEGGDPYGMERVEARMRALRRAPVQEMLDNLVADLIDYVNGSRFEDDITLVALEVAG